MATRITLTRGNKQTVHEIDMRGVSGGAFWCTIIGGVVFAVGFATSKWLVDGNRHYGLWEQCGCNDHPDKDKSKYHVICLSIPPILAHLL